MSTLRAAQVFRGGVTAPHLNYETDQVTAEVRGRSIEFRFKIASKGGGWTKVLLRVGTDGALPLVKEVAKQVPETVVDLTEAVAIANKQNLAELSTLRAKQQPPGQQL